MLVASPFSASLTILGKWTSGNLTPGLIEMYVAFHQTQIKASIKYPDKPEIKDADHSSMLMTAVFRKAA